jgi:hypothetical protein
MVQPSKAPERDSAMKAGREVEVGVMTSASVVMVDQAVWALRGSVSMGRQGEKKIRGGKYSSISPRRRTFGREAVPFADSEAMLDGVLDGVLHGRRG